MSGQAPSDRDQITYLTYDDRAVSQAAIERALRDVESRQRRRQRLLFIRTWVLAVLLVLVLLAMCTALLWWRLTTPF